MFDKNRDEKLFDSKTDLFFESPNIRREPPCNYGVLHLLRRDIFLCLGFDPVSQDRTSHFALWPGGMAILAGVDLLAKFLKGDDSRGQVGSRFCEYINKYFQPISSSDEKAIYQLRNSLLHSFGLYSKNNSSVYRFILSANNSKLIESLGSDIYKIDIIALHQKFEISLDKYTNDLNSDVVLQTNFLKVFENYGAVQVRQETLPD